MWARKAQRLDRHAILQVHHAIIAKAGAARTGCSIKREKLAIIGGQENAARAFDRAGCPIRRLCVIRPVFMVGHATAGQVLEGGVVGQLGVKLPPLLAGLRIEREQDLVGCTGRAYHGS